MALKDLDNRLAQAVFQIDGYILWRPGSNRDLCATAEAHFEAAKVRCLEHMTAAVERVRSMPFEMWAEHSEMCTATLRKHVVAERERREARAAEAVSNALQDQGVAGDCG